MSQISSIPFPFQNKTLIGKLKQNNVVAVTKEDKYALAKLRAKSTLP